MNTPTVHMIYVENKHAQNDGQKSNMIETHRVR